MHFLLIPDSQVYEIHLVIHHGVHVDGDAVPGEDLLGRDVVRPGPQVHTAEGVEERVDEEQARAARSSRPQTEATIISPVAFVKYFADSEMFYVLTGPGGR